MTSPGLGIPGHFPLFLPLLAWEIPVIRHLTQGSVPPERFTVTIDRVHTGSHCAPYISKTHLCPHCVCGCGTNRVPSHSAALSLKNKLLSL